MALCSFIIQKSTLLLFRKMLNSSKACYFFRHGVCFFVLFFCSFSSFFDFPRVKKKELSVFCPCQSQQSTCMSLILYSSRDVTTCLRSSCQKMFVECEKEFPTARCARRIHQPDIKVEEYKQDLWIHFMCLCLCSRT